MNELAGTRLKTADKRLAAELLAKCLEAVKPLCVEVCHLDGSYSVEVAEVSKTCADEPN